MHFVYLGAEKVRLDKFLLEQAQGLSRTQIQKIIKQQPVLVNGKPAVIHHWLKHGDKIDLPDLRVAPQQLPPEQPTEDPICLHEEKDFVVVIKPAGLLVHPTNRHEHHTLAAWLVQKFPHITRVGDDPQRPGILHRLDKDVGGLLLVALTQPSFEYFKLLFQQHVIIKRYYCLVHGDVRHDEGHIATPIDRDKDSGRMVAQSGKESGKEALTLYRVIQRFTGYTLLDVQIVTGRTHQIRTHLYSIGHSVVGDPLYQTRDVRKKKKDPTALTQPFLFAYHLSFVDQEGRPREFTINLPATLQSVLDHLHKL